MYLWPSLSKECFFGYAEGYERENVTRRLGRYILPHLYENYKCGETEDDVDNDDDDDDADNGVDTQWLDDMFRDVENETNDEG
jgi:hypothetical protein